VRIATRVPTSTGVTLRRDFLADARARVDLAAAVTWPNDRWRDDPEGFARDVLGVELWAGQREIVESVRDHRNTTARSGHKTGKTSAGACLSLWFYCSFPDSRVILTSVKAPQVEKVMWREIRKLKRQARIPIDGDFAILPWTGARNDVDERQIFGVNARDGEGLAGLSGANIFVWADEASGINDRFFEVLGSSLAGSGGTARKLYTSNPTRTSGEFYRSHTVNQHIFNRVHISSEDTPNARGTGAIPGLAGPEWIAEKKAEYGEDSPTYRVRVRGEFVHDKDGKIISLDLIAAAQEAWDECPDEGQLQLGIDPAGDGVIGDETAFALRRGNRILTVLAMRGLSEDAIVSHGVGMLRSYRRERDATPIVAIDCEGGIGTRVLGKLRVHLGGANREFELMPVRGGKKMWGSPEFHLVRDALWGEMAKWMQAGGAIPDDAKLAQDLNAPSFRADVNQRYIATDKRDMRKILGRSPDRADAACLAVFGFAARYVDTDGDGDDGPLGDDVEEIDGGAPDRLDPYDGAGVWDR
jgi:phage terminase large subunit